MKQKCTCLKTHWLDCTIEKTGLHLVPFTIQVLFMIAGMYLVSSKHMKNNSNKLNTIMTLCRISMLPKVFFVFVFTVMCEACRIIPRLTPDEFSKNTNIILLFKGVLRQRMTRMKMIATRAKIRATLMKRKAIIRMLEKEVGTKGRHL